MQSNVRSRCLAVAAVLAGLLLSLRVLAGEPFTISDLVEQPQFRSLEAAPSGRWVTFLWTRGDIASNTLHARLTVQRARAGASGETLSEVSVDPGMAINGDNSLNPFGAESLWSPVQDCVAFTRRAAHDIELFVFWPGTRTFEQIASAPRLKIVRWASDGKDLFYTQGEEVPGSGEIRVQDDDNFHAPRWFSGEATSVAWRSHRYTLATRRSVAVADADVPADELNEKIERRLPSRPNDRSQVASVQASPDGKQLAFLGHAFRNIGDESEATREYFIGVASANTEGPVRILSRSLHYPVLHGWSVDRRSILANLRDAQATTIAAIAASNGATRAVAKLQGVTYPEVLSADRTVLFAVQHPPFAPDRIVRVDLRTGKQVVLAVSSAAFDGKELPQTRLMNVSDVGGHQWGVLVYPNGYMPGRRYPLVFTTYRAYSINLLAGSVGGEFPILPWAAHGIAVFCLDTGTANMPGTKGDMVSDGVWRVKMPIDAMQSVISQLSSEGIVDPERVGITGLSYGSEIVDYALAHSRLFRAAAAGGAGFSDPISRWLLPRTRDAEWDERGRVEPDPASWEAWAMISPALNARTARTPLLNNTSSSEALFSVMLWKAYRNAGVPIEWHVYPNEGHVKVYPRNIAAIMTRNLDWMRFWLKDEEDPAPEKAEQYARWREMRTGVRDGN